MKYVVSVNGKQYDIEVEKVVGGYQPMSRQGAAAPVARTAAPAPRTQVQPDPEPAPVKAQNTVVNASDGDTKMEAPMPGTILDVKVKAGDKVSDGQVVLVLEAMKMENEIVSPVDGTIASVMVKKGDTVDSGDILITIN